MNRRGHMISYEEACYASRAAARRNAADVEWESRDERFGRRSRSNSDLYDGPISWEAVSRRSRPRPLAMVDAGRTRSRSFDDEPPWPEEYQWSAPAPAERRASRLAEYRPRRSSRLRVDDDFVEQERPARSRRTRYAEDEPPTIGRNRSRQSRRATADEEPAIPPQREHRLVSWLKTLRKAKADKAFDAAYGGPEPEAVDDPGPRAALYEGQMGRTHKRSQRQANNGGATTFTQVKTGRTSKAGFSISHPKTIVGLAIAVCIVFACVSLYGPAQTYYQQLREHDRLQAELTAVTERNDAIQQQIDNLSTDAGVETLARSEFGWVKEGEQSLSVSGLESEDSPEVTGNVLSTDIDPPQTWYSPVLDFVFGVA